MLVWHAAHQLYALVTDVAAYPAFLPWCERAEIVARDEAGLTARLHLAYAGIRQSFTTRNRHVPDESVRISLVDGPFSRLDGEWLFKPIALPQGETRQACKVDFALRYAFANGVLEAAISPVFDRIANTFVDSFVKRADAVHGAR